MMIFWRVKEIIRSVLFCICVPQLSSVTYIHVNSSYNWPRACWFRFILSLGCLEFCRQYQWHQLPGKTCLQSDLSHTGTIVPECFKDDNASPWKNGKFDPRYLRNPWTDRHLNLHGWLRQMPSRYNYPLRPTNMRKCASSDSASFFLVLPSAYSQNPCTDFHNQYIKWRGFAQGSAFWGSRKQNFTFWPHFTPKMQIFRQFSTRLRKFRVKKYITMGMLTCKLPLIVSIAQWKLYSE